MYGIYGDIYHQYTPNVSIYTSTMDPMGYNSLTLKRDSEMLDLQVWAWVESPAWQPHYVDGSWGNLRKPVASHGISIA